VTIFLVKGVKLQGIVTWFDPFSLLLRRDGSAQLVYKHAISTIMPGQAPADLEFGMAGKGAMARSRCSRTCSCKPRRARPSR
jgi:host factor-I protein